MHMAVTLRKGSSGSEVKKLQQALNKAGYSLNVDGIFGDKTLNAVTNYQKSKGLNVDGIVGSQTWGRLTGGGSSSSGNTGPTAGNAQTAVTPAPAPTATTPLGNTYNPSETTGTKADLTAIEGKAPAFTESQAYRDAMSALHQHQAAKPGEYQSSFADRLNSLHQQIMGRGEYQSPYAEAINDALGKYQNTPYNSPYAGRIGEIYDKIMNRGDFSYDFNADPLYQQYKDQYVQGGQRAMQDAMAEAAALTGGYGNSYAATAGNLAYQQHLTGLNNVIPELQQQAYQRYQDAGQDLMNRLTLTQGLDEMAYGRHNDEMNRLLQQIQTMQGLDESAYGRYQDAGQDLYNRLQITQGMDEDAYNRYRDQVGDYYTDLEYLTGMAGDQYNRDYGQYQDALDKYMADRDYYYGKSQDELAQQNYENEMAAAAAKSSGGGGGSSSGGSKSGSSGSKSGDYKTVLANAKSMTAQKAYDYVNRMVDQGVITAEEGKHILNVEVGMDTREFEEDDTAPEYDMSTLTEVIMKLSKSSGYQAAVAEVERMMDEYDLTTGMRNVLLSAARRGSGR